MMYRFLNKNRDELIARCRFRVAQRSVTRALAPELEHGISHFLTQLIRTLEAEASGSAGSLGVSGRSGGVPELSEIGATAARHGRELLVGDFTIDQVVHDYGDLCQSISELAMESAQEFQVAEFQTLNRCLDNAIAHAVSEYAYQRDAAAVDRSNQAFNLRLGVFAHELRNALATGMLALSVIRTGNLGLGGATGTLLDRSLVRMRNLIDRSLGDVRTLAGLPPQERQFSLAAFIAECGLSGSLEASVKGCTLSVSPVDPALALECDRDMLSGVVGNLLQNAFKFTKRGTQVTLNAYAVSDRVLIEVSDHCGGLPPGSADKLFLAFAQVGNDRSGLGLGLSIAQVDVTACGGLLNVRDRPGTGCVFTIDLPRHALAPIERATGDLTEA